MSWTLKTESPFALDAVIDAHGWIQLHPFIQPPDRPGFDYTLRLASSGRVITCRVAPVEQGIEVTTTTKLNAAKLNAAESKELQQAAAWMVGLDLDLRPFYAHARGEPRLAHMEAGAKGRLLRAPTVYEDLVKTILTTNTTWSGTRRMNETLVNTYGPAATDADPAHADPADGAARHAFPEPARLAAVDPDELRATVKVGYRAPYIVALAQAVATGTLDLETLKDPALSTEEVRKFLLSIKGVGDYAAANMLLLLGHYDFVPVDTAAVKSVGQMWHNGERIGAKEVYAAFENWRPYRGLAYWFWQWD
ncbi:MAG: hypothetical protein WDZ49_17405 [Litorilinea sp.]